jgi:hypothetical protein
MIPGPQAPSRRTVAASALPHDKDLILSKADHPYQVPRYQIIAGMDRSGLPRGVIRSPRV